MEELWGYIPGETLSKNLSVTIITNCLSCHQTKDSCKEQTISHENLTSVKDRNCTDGSVN